MTASHGRVRVVQVVFVVVGLIWVAGLAGCQTRGGPPIGEILAANPAKFGGLTAAPGVFRLQVLLSEVVDDSRGHAKLRRSEYRAGAEYFYPASAIKLCAAVAAVQSLETIKGMTIDSPLVYHPLFANENIRDRDPSNLDGGVITLGHEIRKLFLVSDNESFNRLYEFVGHGEINERMHAVGLASVVVNHRLSVGRSAEENRRTPQIDIGWPSGGKMVSLPERTSDLMIRNAEVPGLRVGVGYMAAGQKLIPEPMDFGTRNGISITDLQDLLVMLARPDIDVGKRPLSLAPEHRQFLLDAMQELPGDSVNPRYDRKEYPDEWGKFFLPGLLRSGVCEKSELRIMNKVGQAYGFTMDNAYIVNTRTGRSFFLTAIIYTNADGILNDDKYEYESVAFPFMAEVGEAVVRSMW